MITPIAHPSLPDPSTTGEQGTGSAATQRRTPVSTQATEVTLSALRDSSGQLDAHGQPQQPMNDGIDDTLQTPECLGHPAVAAAVTAYLTTVNERYGELREHLAAVAAALAQVDDRYADTENQVTADMQVGADERPVPVRRPA